MIPIITTMMATIGRALTTATTVVPITRTTYILRPDILRDIGTITDADSVQAGRLLSVHNGTRGILRMILTG